MKDNTANSDVPGNKPETKELDPADISSKWSYFLVLNMLGALTLLVILVIAVPLLFVWIGPKDLQNTPDLWGNLVEYSKWTISVLLGAFGAWIGAGAAYFFGKENLRESSRSTERALEIQREGLQRKTMPQQVKEMNLTAINTNFMFNTDSPKGAVVNGLKTFKGYWFVPIVNSKTGALLDIVHARLFWGQDFDDKLSLGEIIAKLDEVEERRNLHGNKFYTTVSPDDKIADVYDTITKRDLEVAIVVDSEGKPTHCLSKTDLIAVLKPGT